MRKFIPDSMLLWKALTGISFLLFIVAISIGVIAALTNLYILKITCFFFIGLGVLLFFTNAFYLTSQKDYEKLTWADRRSII